MNKVLILSLLAIVISGCAAGPDTKPPGSNMDQFKFNLKYMDGNPNLEVGQ